MIARWLVGILFFCLPIFVSGQDAVPPVLSPSNKITWQKVRLSFDDDYMNFTGHNTDQYYTAGWQVDAFYKRNDGRIPLTDKLLMTLPNAGNSLFYGMCRKIYTPINLTDTQVVPHDRPYASVLTIQHGMISENSENHEVLTTEIGIGAIGPVTYGGQIQKWFHKMIGDQLPAGWNNQVSNDVILDYQFNYEKQVLQPSSFFAIAANIDAEAGTLVDNFGLGMILELGKEGRVPVMNPLQHISKENTSSKLQLHFYMHPTVRAVIYNATLEGGVFTYNSPYTISQANMSSFYLQYDMGLLLVSRRWALSYSQKIRTPEFNTATIQSVGNLTMSVALR